MDRLIRVYYKGRLIMTCNVSGTCGDSVVGYIDRLLTAHYPKIEKTHTFYSYTGRT